MFKQVRAYVVWQGRKPGVYRCWRDAEEQIDGLVDAAYEPFESLGEALRAYGADSPDDPVGSGENLGAQDVDPSRAEGSRDFAEQARTIPRADFRAGVASIRLVVPGHDRLERFILFRQLMVHEAVCRGEV